MTILTSTGAARRFEVLDLQWDPQDSVTEHPVETGVEISDHAQRRSDRFVARLIVSNSQLGSYDGGELAAEQFLENARQQLLTIEIRGQVTRSNYILEAFPSSRNHEERRVFSARFKQVRFAQAIAVNVPVEFTSSPGSVPSSSLGLQPSGPGRPSIAAQLGGFVE